MTLSGWTLHLVPCLGDTGALDEHIERAAARGRPQLLRDHSMVFPDKFQGPFSHYSASVCRGMSANALYLATDLSHAGIDKEPSECVRW